MEFRILRRDIESNVNRQQYLLSPMEEEHVLRLARYEVTEAKLEQEMNRCSRWKQGISRSYRKVEKIDVFKVTFSDRKCELLANGIKEIEHLSEIVIDKCKFRTNHMEMIADAIGTNEAIQSITFSNVKILESTAIHLSTALSQNMSLKSLTLIETGMGDKAMTQLS